MTSPPLRYLFSVNTGRCGSYYLARLLSCATGVHSYHEPEPTGQGRALVAWNNNDPGPMEAEVAAKLEFIRGHDLGAGGVYSEMSNAFVKGFGWMLLERLPQEQVGVIVLRREIGATVESLMAASDLPSLAPDDGFWLLRPDFKKNVIRFVPGLSEWWWYVREVYARGEAMRDAYPKVRFFDAPLARLNDLAGVLELFAALGLTADLEKLRRVVGVPLNTRSRPGDEQQSRHGEISHA
jgi:hypothetical protein